MRLELHKKQSLAFESQATEILFGGAAGGGKSHCMRVIALFYALSVENIQIYLFRRISEDLKKNHLDGASGFNVLLADYVEAKFCKINYSTNQIVFTNGSKINLCHCNHEKDILKYQGVEIHILLIDELTHFSESIYNFLRSRVRIGALKVPEKFKEKIPFIFCSSNPGGVGHEFVKREFIDNLTPFEIKRTEPEKGAMLRQFIPALLKDNPTMTENDPLYAEKLLALGGALAKAMLYGDWDAIEGAYFEDFKKELHIIKPILPERATIVKAFDWGYSSPFCCLWGFVSDGFIFDGRYIPPNALVVFREIYSSKMTNFEIAQFIKETEIDLDLKNVSISVADPAIFANNGGVSIAEQLAENDVVFVEADNKRVAGWQQIKHRLKGDDKSEGLPLLYITENCKNLLRTLPTLLYDKNKFEDLNTDMEDHAADALRYLCMTRATKLEPERQKFNYLQPIFYENNFR